MKATRFMTRAVVALDTGATIAEALTLVNAWRVGCLPVLDDEHRIVGVLDERQLLRARLAGTPELVAGLIGGRTVCLDESAEADEVAAAILEHDVPGAAIVAEGELVGVVTRGDALRALLRERRGRVEEFDSTAWRVRVDDDGGVTIAGLE